LGLHPIQGPQCTPAANINQKVVFVKKILGCAVGAQEYIMSEMFQTKTKKKKKLMEA
jgi:hypothetical protein